MTIETIKLEVRDRFLKAEMSAEKCRQKGNDQDRKFQIGKMQAYNEILTLLNKM